MKKSAFIAILFTAMSSCAFAQTTPIDSLQFIDASGMVKINQIPSAPGYQRLANTYKDEVRPPVWKLSLNSAGIAIRFRSNANMIAARWVLKFNSMMSHMAYTGIKGLDLYALENGQWQYVRTAIPQNKKENENIILRNGADVEREYMLYLPLYDGVDSLWIGINKGAYIKEPANSDMLDKKPVVYYGSSIAQGGCASRTGMAFTNILSRELHRPFINLGFSGNGKSEAPIGKAMNEVDAALYVLDCNPNSEPGIIYDRTVALVHQLKQAHPYTPVLMVEGYLYENGYFDEKMHPLNRAKNKESKRAYDHLIASGVKGLYYIPGTDFIGTDHEGTVDGVHPTDVGMERIAESLKGMIEKIINN
ncbi:hydrolase [Chitinophaga caeni]|uniref:Hydrolase n=1 Tax=Chitinophaga caeni TaxID=2029983 RepID=A0A291QX96_9BACT|nr:SGNH/GDSL hydrolase family protein [Chitinophaga caeni]ATL48578.1 hydrolase [Chitinophaga caeni]